MNHSYRVVFNESTNTYTAVAEIAKARGKKSKSSKAAAVVAVGLSLGFASNAFAAQTTVQGTKNVVEASGTAVYGNYNAVAGIGAQMIVVGNSNDVGGKAKVRSTAETVGGFEIDPSAGLTETDSATSNSRNTVVIGNVNTVTNSASAVVLGRGITMTNADRAISMGLRSSVTQADAVALGSFAKATGEDSLAMGSYALAAANGSLAIGSNSNVTGNQSISVGVGNQVSGSQSGAFGDPSIISGAGSYTVGNDNAVGSTSTNVGAFGNNNQIGATATYVDGKLQTVSGLTDTATVENSRAVGNKNYINTSNTYVLGSGVGTKDDGTVLGTVENSVYLGNDSTVAKGAAVGTKNLTKEGAEGTTTTAGDIGTVDTATVAGVTYGSFAGKTAAGAVSVGSAGLERRVMNVAAGEISATSTDAINGSQLYLVASGLTDQMPVIYTDTSGNKVYKQPDGSFVDSTGAPYKGDVIASMNDGDTTANTPQTLANVHGNLTPTYNTGDMTIGADGKPTTTAATGPTTSQTGPSAADAADMYNNAATVGDVLNSGWNLQNNGTAKDFVKAYDTVNFVNGTGTTAVVETATDGKSSTVKYNVNVDGTTITTKTVTDPVTGATTSQITANTTPLTTTDGKVNTPANTDALATAGDIANAINNSGWKLAADGTTGTELINPSDTVTFKAGSDNLTVKRTGSDITYDLAKDININSVQFNDGPKITSDGNNIKVGDKDGNATKITNVAKGDVNATSTDAVNGSQLYQAVNNINTSIAASKEEVTSNDKSVTVTTTQNAKGANIYDVSVNVDGTTITKDVTTGAIKANTTPLTTTDGKVNTPANENALATAGDIANAINNSGFNIIGAGNNAGGAFANELINPGDTVTLEAGKNLTVAQTNGKFVFATADDVNFNSVQIGADGPKITSDGNNIKVGDKDGNATSITNITSGLTTNNINTAPTGTGSTATSPIVDLNNTNVSNNTAATVGDLRNMGWVVSASDNGYVDTVKNANQVDFVGTGLATVSGKTENGIRTITVDVNAQSTVETAQTPVVYTNKDGDKVYKKPDGTFVDDKGY